MPIPGGAERAWLEAFVEELRLRRYSPSSQNQARLLLPRILSDLKEQGVEDLRGVSEGELVSFASRLSRRTTRQGTPLSPWTQGAYLGILRRFFGFLCRKEVLLLNPAASLHLPRIKRLPRAVLSLAQARRLMAAPSPLTRVGLRDRAILETLYGTGIRLMECVGLDAMDVDLLEGSLLVRGGKGRKDRHLPLLGRAAEALDLYLREVRPALLSAPGETALFLTLSGRRISPVTLQALVRQHGKAAGIPTRVHPHALRHACATHLLRGGADVRHVQEILGHSDIRTTALYTRVETEDLREVLRRCHPRERVSARSSSRRT